MDITPLIPAGRQLIQRYGEGGFRISGQRYDGSVIVFRERTLSWPVGAIGDVQPDSLRPVLEATEKVGILLVGCGKSAAALPSALRQVLRDAGIVMEVMDTGAACRTFNVLLAEDRLVAAALIAV